MHSSRLREYACGRRKISGALGGDQFEAFAQRPIRRQAGDQDLGELATRDDAVAGIAGVAAIPLKEYESMLVWRVVVKPARSTIVYGNPLARTSRSPRSVQSWASVCRPDA